MGLRFTSIEGSRTWYEHMRRQNFSQNTTLLYVNIGETGAFSYPKDPSKGEAYIGAIRKEQDVVLVDGRWRVACAVAAFPFISSDGRLMMHDFTRKRYHSILELYEKEVEVDGLAVLKRRDNVTVQTLKDFAKRFGNIAE